jgi:NADH-quinone oxidoreductase subunit N
MFDTLSWIAIYPEIVLLVMACVVTLFDLGVKDPMRKWTHILTLVSLALLAFLHGMYASGAQTHVVLGGLWISDPMGHWLKCFATVAVMVTLVYARPYARDRDMLRGGELFSLSMFALLGMSIMISGQNFLVLYLGLELLTLSSYVLVALRRDDKAATEAAMKYFVLGAMASGFLLYGLSMVYGATGSLDVNTVLQILLNGQTKHQVMVFGVVFVVAGLAFKLGAAPFHTWVPDVYHGAPTAATLMIAGAPKLAAFALVIRLLVEGLLPLAFDWQQMLVALSVASLVIGNLAAIAQTNIKRMLAYSTIAQMGFVLLGLVAGVVNGNPALAVNAYSSAMFYVVSYVLTTLATFGVLLVLARQGQENDAISDLAGLNQRSPLYAAIMGICLFSLAGIPPMVGFQAKLSVLQSLVASGQSLYTGLAVFAVIMSLIGAFYYLRVVKVMYFDAPTDSTPLVVSVDVRSVLTVNGLLVLVLGVLPGGLLALCAQSVWQMLVR